MSSPSAVIGRERPGTRTSPPLLTRRRLAMMRAAYGFMGIGLAIVKWPQVVSPDPGRLLAQGVVDSLLTALSLLALLGLWHPIRMLLVLVFEVMWKLLWLASVALPAIVAGTTDAAMRDVIVSCALALPVLIAVPWRFAWRRYLSSERPAGSPAADPTTSTPTTTLEESP